MALFLASRDDLLSGKPSQKEKAIVEKLNAMKPESSKKADVKPLDPSKEDEDDDSEDDDESDEDDDSDDESDEVVMRFLLLLSFGRTNFIHAYEIENTDDDSYSA